MDPFALMRDMLSFDPLFGGELGVGPELSFVPRTNVRERADAYEITADVPGVQLDDIEITCAGNTLTIGGEVRDEDRQEGERYHSWERVYGRFSRSFTLPEGADAEKVSASMDNGVLRVTIPKRASVQPKRIPVSASQAGERQESARRQSSQQAGQSSQQAEQSSQQAGQHAQERQVAVEKKAA